MNTLYCYLLGLILNSCFLFCQGQVPTTDSLQAKKPEITASFDSVALIASVQGAINSDTSDPLNGLIIGGSKDNPTLFNKKMKIDSMVQSFMGDSLLTILQTADTVQVFFLNGWHKDSTSTGFEGFKVKQRVMNLGKGQKDTLRTVLTSKESYIFSKWAKKADFIPALGFRFLKGDKSFSCLMAYDCDLIQFIGSDGKHSKKENCDPSHSYFKEIGSALFKEFKTNADKNPINQPEYIKSIFD